VWVSPVAGDLGQHVFDCVSCFIPVVQERQDALYEITDDPSINMMVVVGGFNSSNTSHLQEIAEHKGISSFWVDSAARIDVEGNKVIAA
jgi:4-hydroxy-3-methylbut-2-enyl diphosphate reductase